MRSKLSIWGDPVKKISEFHFIFLLSLFYVIIQRRLDESDLGNTREMIERVVIKLGCQVSTNSAQVPMLFISVIPYTRLISAYYIVLKA